MEAGREEAFRELVERHSPMVFRVAYRITGNESDAEDVVQEAFLKAYRNFDSYDSRASFSTWIYRIALNAAISWTRKQDRHQRGKQPLEVVDGLLAASAAEADPRVEWLYRQIARLKDVDRSVALLMLDGFAYREIAAIAGISEGNVAVKINRIKMALSA